MQILSLELGIMPVQDQIILEQEMRPQEAIITELEITVITLQEIVQTIITIITQQEATALLQGAKA